MISAAYSELLGLIYEASENPAQWQSFLNRFAEVTGARQSLLTISTSQQLYNFAHRYGVSEEEIGEYFQKYGMNDPWALALQQHPEGVAMASHELWPEEEMEKSALYREFFAPRHWHYGMGGVFLKTPEGPSALTMVRSKEQGPCTPAEVALLEGLLPHLRRAALLGAELARLRSERAALIGHLDRMPRGFVLTAADSKVLLASAAAQEITATGDGLFIEGGQLRAVHAEDNAHLLQAIRQCDLVPGALVSRIKISRSSGSRPYWVMVIPVPRKTTVPLGVAQPRAAVLIMDPASVPEPDSSMLRDLFQLTATEARLTALLVQGQSVEEAAATLGMALDTARTHMRRIFAKTATRRQGELIGLVMRTVPYDLRGLE